MESFPFRVVFFNKDTPDSIVNKVSKLAKGIEIQRPHDSSNVLWLKISAKDEFEVYKKAAKFKEQHKDTITNILLIAKR